MSAILQLTLIAFRGLVPATSNVREYDQDEILIGRAPDNDFVVEDPERYCSRYHARCYRADNQFFVEDTSTPGTQINAGQFLTRGHRHRLVSGDLLHIGECQIQIDLIESVVPLESSNTCDAFSIDDFFSEDSGAFTAELVKTTAPLPNIPQTSTADFIRTAEPHYEGFDFSEYAKDLAVQDQSIDHHRASDVVIATDIDAVVYSEEVDVANDQYVDLEVKQASVLSVDREDALVEGKVDLSTISSDCAETVQTASQKVVTGNAPAEIDSKAIKAFLQGLNVEPSDLVGRNKEEIMFSAGQMLRVLTQGTMEILQSRSDVKKEFGMDVTRIGAQMNNPLKFSHSSNEAMVKLLTQAEGYMSAHDAVKEGVVDAKAHQVAVMAGMQAAIVSMLERFKPEALEDQLNSRFVLSKKGKHWETYKKVYQQLVLEAEDDFHSLFGDEFSLVYQQQVREIEASYSQE